MTAKPISRVWTLLFAVSLAAAGCASRQPAVDASLDRNTGWTVATTRAPALLARGAPRIAHGARDYVYLGPVQVNRMGLHELYLWVGLVSTIDRAPLGEQALAPEALTVVVDGVPMPLQLRPWSEDLPASPYQTPTPPYQILGARLSRDQVDRIANAQQVEVFVAAGNRQAVRYRVWRGDWPRWAGLTTDPAGGPADSAVATLE